MPAPRFLHATIGSYKLVSFLGAGGMGEVYRATDQHLGRDVAVKVMMQQDAKFLARFRNEAHIQSGLRHANIATFYEFLEYEGHPCIVMECVAGRTLEDYLRTQGPLPLAEAISIFQALTEAVAYMHSHGVIHRDLKTSNVKITPSGEVKLLDFGIAKGHASPGLTATGAVIGTPAYLAPEQLKGHSADARSDIWALGVLFYEMLTGHAPFEADNILDLYSKISKAVFVPPTVLNPAISSRVEAILARCLRRDPEDRYASAQALQKALTRAANTRTTSFRRLMPIRRASERHFAALRQALRAKRGRTNLREEKKPEKEAWRLPGSTWLLPGVVVTALFALLGYALWPRPADVVLPPSGEGDTLEVVITVVAGRAQVLRADGTVLGTTPYRIKGPRNSKHSLLLRQEGYHDEIINVEVNERRQEYPITMDRVRR